MGKQLKSSFLAGNELLHSMAKNTTSGLLRYPMPYLRIIKLSQNRLPTLPQELELISRNVYKENNIIPKCLFFLKLLVFELVAPPSPVKRLMRFNFVYSGLIIIVGVAVVAAVVSVVARFTLSLFIFFRNI